MRSQGLNVKRKVYIETSVVSYLAAKPSRDLLAAAWQEITTIWWDHRRHGFDLYTPELAIDGRRGK